MYKKQKYLHFIGIGGIGMSGIAEILKKQGYHVSGCDVSSSSKIIDHLKEIGCVIYKGHSPKHINDTDVLVYSSALDNKNPEIAEALKKGIPVIPRAIMLAEIMRTKHSVAVSGAHGKTTTTSMLSHILIEAGEDPSVIVGGVLKNSSTNAKLGSGELIIAEADESDRSLLYLNPSLAIVNNIDAEHLDTYKDLEDVKQTFRDFLARLPFYGKAFVGIDDPGVKSILPISHIPIVKYGMSNEADVRGEILELEPTHSVFNVYSWKKNLGNITINMPGKHNVHNALAAISVCLELDVSFEKIKNALASFKGIERRFEFKGIFNGAEIFDDYGHHPTEIENTLKIARNRAKGQLIVAFQPHRFTRTQKLWNEFVNLLANFEMDELYLADIYPASEKPIEGITSQNLINAIKKKSPNKKCFYFQTFEELENRLKNKLANGDLLITIGAGKLNQVGEILINSAY
ncbi:UDP-N-acetylmuramate--L-alanine ligase [Candidatus Babeliales bacterium]|nr:UDP-N-acetylmuramate--L-alanine ligase [Candidatus Babeliales bacterium]